MHLPLFGNVIAFFFLLKSQDILLEGVGQMVNLTSLDYIVGYPSIRAGTFVELNMVFWVAWHSQGIHMVNARTTHGH